MPVVQARWKGPWTRALFYGILTALQTSAEKELELAPATTGSSEDTCCANEGLFEARLDLQRVPTVWEARDLRSDVSGGDRTCTENVNRLVCGSIIP